MVFGPARVLGTVRGLSLAIVALAVGCGTAPEGRLERTRMASTEASGANSGTNSGTNFGADSHDAWSASSEDDTESALQGVLAPGNTTNSGRTACYAIADRGENLQPHRTICRKADYVYDTTSDWPIDQRSFDVYYPKGVQGPLPLVLLIHGGGWSMHRKDDAREREIGALLASAGYLVQSVGYPLFTTTKGTYPTNIQFINKALGTLVHDTTFQGRIDTGRMATFGGSAGGHLALMTALTNGDDRFNPGGPRWRFRAIVDFYGITNLNSRKTTASDGTPGTIEPLTSNLGLFGPAGANRNAQDLWTLKAEASPVTYVTAATPPTLIVHSQNDVTVDRDQSKELFDKILRVNPPLLPSDYGSSEAPRVRVFGTGPQGQPRLIAESIRLKNANHSFTLEHPGGTPDQTIEALEDGSTLRRRVLEFLRDAMSQP